MSIVDHTLEIVHFVFIAINQDFFFYLFRNSIGGRAIPTGHVIKRWIGNKLDSHLKYEANFQQSFGNEVYENIEIERIKLFMKKHQVCFFSIFYSAISNFTWEFA